MSLWGIKESVMIDITVEIRDVKDVGGCNACNDHKDRNYKVYDVTLKYVSFRVCKKCKTELMKQLREKKYA
jgi:hypothetical protein